MALSDTEIRKALIMSLEDVIDMIRNYELPLAQTGYLAFIKAGVFGDKVAGGRRHWIASVAVSDDRTDIHRIRDTLKPHDNASQN